MSRTSLITYLLLSAFIGLAVFGFAIMGTHDGMSGQVNCIASIGQAALCSHSNTLAMAALHSDFFQLLTSMAILFFLFALAWTLYKKIPDEDEPTYRTRDIDRRSFISAHSHQPFLRWLSLHEQVA